MYFIITEDGVIYKTSVRAHAMDASDDDTCIVIDATAGVEVRDREAAKIEVWEPEEGEDE